MCLYDLIFNCFFGISSHLTENTALSIIMVYRTCCRCVSDCNQEHNVGELY